MPSQQLQDTRWTLSAPVQAFVGAAKMLPGSTVHGVRCAMPKRQPAALTVSASISAIAQDSTSEAVSPVHSINDFSSGLACTPSSSHTC
jgi:hypothetical protein